MRKPLSISSILATSILLPTIAHASEENLVRVYSVTNANVVTLTATEDLSDAHPAGWSFTRPYVSGGTHYVFALKRQTGEAQIFDATAGNMGLANTGVYDLGTDWTSAAIYYVAGAPFLVLHRSRDGMMWRYALPSDGSLGTKTTFANVSAWRDKSDFVPYFDNGALRFAATDRWTGRAAFHDGNGVAIHSNTWTQGWTSPDYFDSGAAGTWRVLYKPLETPGDEIGRIVVQKVGADGETSPTLSDTTVLGYTHVRFVRTPPPGGSTRLFFYNAPTGHWSLRSFSAVTGLGAQVASGDIAANMVDLSTYVSGSTVYIYGVQEDEHRVLTQTELDALGGGPDGPDGGSTGYGTPSSVYNNMEASDGPGGWELAYMQGGRLVLRVDAGWSNFGEDIAMDGTRHIWNFGSVSKALTGITAVKLHERGEIDLDAPLEVYLDPDAYPTVHSDNRYITTRDIVGYESGWEGEEDEDGNSTCSVSCESNWLCPEALEQDRECPSCEVEPGGHKDCGVAYANSNFLVARNVIEWTMGLRLAADETENQTQIEGRYVAYMRWLWWNRAGIGDNRCTPSPVTHADTREDSEQLYYSPACSASYDEDQCIDLDGSDLSESIYLPSEPGNSAACGQGGVQSTAEDMAQFLAALRYERVLSPDGTAYAFEANPDGGRRVGFYGSQEDTTVSPSVFFKGKNGGNVGIAESVIQRWSIGTDSALVTNETPQGGTTNVLMNSWLDRPLP
jgi:CubicO group peptidase (beta-lactamase class C family)